MPEKIISCPLAREKISNDIMDIQTEFCFYIEAEGPLLPEEADVLSWLLSETFEPENFSSESFLTHGVYIEAGPA